MPLIALKHTRELESAAAGCDRDGENLLAGQEVFITGISFVSDVFYKIVSKLY